jgi:hypothetical protein
MTKLNLLYTEKARKFDDICTLVAGEFDYSEFSKMDSELRKKIEDAAEQYIKLWEETFEVQPKSHSAEDAAAASLERVSIFA